MKKIYNGKISEIARVSKDLEAFCEENDVEREILFAFTLCLDEVFSNIVEYGYVCAKGEVEIELGIKDGMMSAVISDTALPFNPLTQVEAPNFDTDLDARKIGGLGVFFIKKQMDELSYQRKNGRNILSLSKKLRCLT